MIERLERHARSLGLSLERATHVARLHTESIVVDAHADSLRASVVGDPRYNPRPDGGVRLRRMWERGDAGHWDFVRALEAGQSAQIVNLLVPRPRHGPFARTCLTTLERALTDLEHAPRRALLATTTEDVERAHRERKVALILAIEGAEAIEGDLEMLHLFRRLGVRMMGLTWMYRNELGEGNWEDSGAGLSDFGRSAVATMNELGMIVDVAHATERTYWDAIDTSTAPVVCSHGGCRATVVDFADHAPSRYLDDDQLRALAAQGGVLGIFFSVNRELANADADLPEFARFFVHAAEVMGPEHVGLGSDMDGGFPPRSLHDVSRLPLLTSALIDAGFSDEELRGILGGNWMRVFARVWHASRHDVN